MNIIAIIPARGGSKRIPDKNIRLFCGKPIISYSIDAANKSKIFDRIIVSTDSERIAATAKEYGAEVPFMRPTELADDYADTDVVIQHALKWFLENGEIIKYSCCIYATAPFIRSHYICEGFELMKKENATTAFSVTSYSSSIFRSLKINREGRLEMFWPENLNMRSQDLPEAYHDAGQFYWADVEKYLRIGRMFNSNSIPIILPRWLVQDIDTPEDWHRAELMYKAFIATSEQ